MRTFSAPELDALLAPVALERARLLAPWILGAMIVALLVSEPTGVPLTGFVVGWNAFAVAVMTGVIALTRGGLEPRWGHLALVIVWWLPLCGTLLSQLHTGNETLTYLIIVEVAASAVMLQRRWVIGSFVALDALWIPLAIQLSGDRAPLFITLVLSAQIYAVLLQHLVRSSLLHAETHRLMQADTSRELAHQLAELRRSEEERARLSEQLLHAQRMEAAGTLAAGLAHDMNNILGSIKSFAELLINDTTAPQIRSDLMQIAAQADRGAELTRGLLAFSRRGQYRKQVLEIDRVLSDLVPLLSRTLPKSITIRNELAAGPVRIEGDPSQLGQVVINLAVNAAHAMDGKGTLTLRSERVELDAATAGALGTVPGPHVRIHVIDTGAGMDEPTRLRVFEPFFTTKPLGKGTGLGLSTAWGVVNGHGGAIDVESRPGQGATFRVHLPLTDAPVLVRSRVVTAESRAFRGTVLVIDDEPMVRAGTRRILERKGFTVIEAENGEEGLAAFAQHAEMIGLVILDMGMPVMSGPECFTRLREISDVPVLVATGYTSDSEAQSLIAQGASLIEKPYAAADLTRQVVQMLAES